MLWATQPNLVSCRRIVAMATSPDMNWSHKWKGATVHTLVAGIGDWNTLRWSVKNCSVAVGNATHNLARRRVLNRGLNKQKCMMNL